MQLASRLFTEIKHGEFPNAHQTLKPIPDLKGSLEIHVLAAELVAKGDLRSGLTFVVNSDLQNNSKRRERERGLNSTIHQKDGPRRTMQLKF